MADGCAAAIPPLHHMRWDYVLLLFWAATTTQWHRFLCSTGGVDSALLLRLLLLLLLLRCGSQEGIKAGTLHTYLLIARNLSRFLDGAAEVSNRAYVVIEGQHAISSQVGEASSHSNHHEAMRLFCVCVLLFHRRGPSRGIFTVREHKSGRTLQSTMTLAYPLRRRLRNQRICAFRAAK